MTQGSRGGRSCAPRWSRRTSPSGRTRGGAAPASRFGIMLAELGLLFALTRAQRLHERRPAHDRTRGARRGRAVPRLRLPLLPPGPARDAARARAHRTFAVATVVLWLVTLPLVETLPASGPLVDCGHACPANAFQLVDTPDAVSSALGFAVNGVTALALLEDDRAAPRTIPLAGDLAPSPRPARPRLGDRPRGGVFRVHAAAELDIGGLTGLKVVGAVAALAIPLAMLVGQVRGRVFTATSLVELVGRVGGEPVTAARVEGLLRDALGDPLLRFALRRPGQRVRRRRRQRDRAARRPP